MASASKRKVALSAKRQPHPTVPQAMAQSETIEDGHREAVKNGLDQARSGQFASQVDVDAAYRRF